jgi:hypothetical protein
METTRKFFGHTRQRGAVMARTGRRETELRLSVDAHFLQELQDKLGVDRATDVGRAALTILNWAADEASRGRVILSSTSKGEDIHRLVMPELTTAARRC